MEEENRSKKDIEEVEARDVGEDEPTMEIRDRIIRQAQETQDAPDPEDPDVNE